MKKISLNMQIRIYSEEDTIFITRKKDEEQAYVVQHVAECHTEHLSQESHMKAILNDILQSQEKSTLEHVLYAEYQGCISAKGEQHKNTE